MAGINKVIIVGRLGKDPEIRYNQQGNAICNFSVATSESWTDKQGQKQEQTEWHRIVVFNKQAENCEKYLSKGRQVYVEGRLKTNSYDKDGQTHYSTDIVANTVQFLGDQGSGQNQGGNPQGQGYQPPNQGYRGNQQPRTNQGQGYGPEPQEEEIPF